MKLRNIWYSIILICLYNASTIAMEPCRGDGHLVADIQTHSIDAEQLPAILNSIKAILTADGRSVAVALSDIKQLCLESKIICNQIGNAGDKITKIAIALPAADINCFLDYLRQENQQSYLEQSSMEQLCKIMHVAKFLDCQYRVEEIVHQYTDNLALQLNTIGKEAEILNMLVAFDGIKNIQLKKAIHDKLSLTSQSILVPHIDTLMPKVDGHCFRKEITSLATDGTKLYAGFGSTINVWDLQTHEHANVIEEVGFNLVALIVNNDRLYAGSDETIHVLDLHNNECINVLDHREGGLASMHALAISSDCLYSSNENNAIKLWYLNALDSGLMNILDRHQDTVSTLVIDKNLLYSGSYDHTIRVWDTQDDTCITTLEGDDKIHSLAIDKGRLYAGCYGGAITVWDLQTHACINKLISPDKKCMVSAITIDGDRLYAGYSRRCFKARSDINFPAKASGKAFIKIWDLQTNECINTLESTKNAVNALIINGDRLYSADEAIHVWDLGIHKKLKPEQLIALHGLIAMKKKDPSLVIRNTSLQKIITSLPDNIKQYLGADALKSNDKCLVS